MSGKSNRRRNAIALAISAALHILFLSFVINETANPYALPEVQPPPLEVQIFPQEEVPQPPPPPVVIPPKLRQVLEKQTPPPPPLPPTPVPPKPEPQPPTPVAPPRVTPPKPNPPTPTPPTPPAPTQARPSTPKQAPIPAAPTPARTPTPPAPSPSPSPGPSPSPRPPTTATIISRAPMTAHTPTPQVVMRPSKLNLHKSNHEVPSNVPTLPLAPGGAVAAGGGGPQGGGVPGAPGAPGGSRLNGLSPYPYGALPSGGPGLRGTLVGCANADAVNLTNVERARCNERFGVEAGRAPALDGINPAKRASFDRAADRQERARDTVMPNGTDKGNGTIAGLGDTHPLTIPLPQ